MVVGLPELPTSNPTSSQARNGLRTTTTQKPIQAARRAASPTRDRTSVAVIDRPPFMARTAARGGGIDALLIGIGQPRLQVGW